MEIISLPRDLKFNEQEPIQVFNYRNDYNINKTKIHLSKNVISFLRAGSKEVHGNDQTVQINEQHFLLMKSGNCLMTEKVPDLNQAYKSVLLFFSDQQVTDFLERHQLYSSKASEMKSIHIFQYDQFIEHFVASLEKVLLLPQATQRKMLQTKFEEIMLYLSFKNGAAFLNNLIQQIDNKVARLNNVVENNKYNRLSLEELAFLANMSVSTFKRTFFKLYEETPMKWFNDKRLDHTAILLKTKQKRPIELYEDAGYESFSNFVQAFKKKFGLTPKQYQMSH